jgi:hypothetical protein
VQQPENTQNYNRYSYVLNNPLRYTDPSGELFLAPLAWGITSGVLPYLASAVFAHTPFSFEGLAKTYYISAASALATYGIGSAAGSMFSQPAMGFWQGAAQGALIGGVTGIGGSLANAAFTGQNITLKAVLKGAAIGAVVGGVIGGIDGGIRAQENDANFWSGKNIHNDIKIGKATISLNNQDVDFSDSNWEVKAEMKLKQFNQNPGDTMCSYKCKESVDDYFGLKPNNSDWQNAAKNNTVRDYYLPDYFRKHYNVLKFGSNPGEDSVSFMIKEMNSNHVVHVSWRPVGNGVDEFHSSLVTKIEQNIKTLAYRFQLMDPAKAGGFDLKLLKNVFSIWKK